MTLEDEVKAAARTLQDVSSGLASALSIAAKRRNAASGVVDTFHEAEALNVTVSAILDDAASTLQLLQEDAKVVGRALRVGDADATVHNGFDSLALILLTLLRKATDAVSDVAANQSQWLVSPLQAKQCMEAMCIHHGQLKAMYGLLHLAGKVIDLGDVQQSLFVDVSGESPRPELEPSRWQSAVNIEPLLGRFFGFHYPPELRNFLLVVNIARGSISTASATTPDTSSPLVRNFARLGWGWVYSNMVLLNNLGVTIDQASKIGKDGGRGRIEDVRAFMNLSEDPVLTSVSSLASADVAVDFAFQIIPESAHPQTAEASTSPSKRLEIPVPEEPISVRVISHPGRPVDRSLRSGRTPLELSRESSLTAHPTNPSDSSGAHDLDGAAGNGNVGTHGHNREASPATGRPGDCAPTDEQVQTGETIANATASSNGPLQTLSSFVQQMQDTLGSATAAALGSRNASRAGSREGRVESSGGERMDAGKVLEAVQTSMAEITDSSMLASAIKSELVKLHSNVSSFLAPDIDEPASALIIHFHGGGFVSQSSAGHAVYLKEWAADLPDAVILSVDYRLAPEGPFPAALDDCLYAYYWALENAERLGTTARRVVLCGDSAGGNLAVAVALKAQTHGIRSADGICLCYPALYVNVAWSPSRLLSFFDPLLPLSILDICLRSYVPEGADPHRNPFISPLVAAPDALRSLPPVVFISGSLDPLLDDSVQFAHNLKACGRDSDAFRIMEGLCHGFLNMIQVSKDARFASKFLCRRMATLLDIPVREGGLETANEQATAVFDT